MSTESRGFHEVPPQETSETDEEKAKRELSELGIETHQENLDALIAQQNTQQHPTGYEDLLAVLNEPNKLIQLMKKKGITSIIHSEGLTVWDHAKLTIQEIESMDIPDEKKADLKLIMLYHDLGKTIVGQNERNTEQTKKKLKKGDLHQTMIGHHREKLSDIEAGFKANGVEGQKLKMFMIVVENHMNTPLLEQNPTKTVKLFEKFGNNDEEREKVVRLLTLVLQVDGEATQRINLVDGKLNYSKNEEKLKLNFDKVWEKYKEGQKTLQTEAEQKKIKKAEAELEISILGKKLSAYLIQDREIQPGPNMREIISRIKGIITDNANLSPEQIKAIIETTTL